MSEPVMIDIIDRNYGKILHRWDFASGNLTGLNLDQAVMDGNRLSEVLDAEYAVSIDECSMRHSEWNHVKSTAHPHRVDFTGSYFNECQFKWGHFTHCDFTDAALDGCEFVNCNFFNCKFGNALLNSRFDRCYFNGGSLVDARVEDAQFDEGNTLNRIKGVVNAGHDMRGFMFMAFKSSKHGWFVKAGCRYYSWKDARIHWLEAHEQDQYLHNDIMIRLNTLQSLIQLHGQDGPETHIFNG